MQTDLKIMPLNWEQVKRAKILAPSFSKAKNSHYELNLSCLNGSYKKVVFERIADKWIILNPIEINPQQPKTKEFCQVKCGMYTTHKLSTDGSHIQCTHCKKVTKLQPTKQY